MKHFSAFSKKSLEAGIHSEKVHQFYKDLVKVQGLRTVYASRDGTTFGCELDTDHKWEKVLLEIVSVFQEHLAGKQKMIRVGRKSQPTSREYAAVHREQAKEGSW